MDLCKFTADKPVILVIGGSLGSVVVNNAVRESLPCLLKDFQIIHLCGKGKTDESLKNTKGYCQFEYVKDELRDIFALSEIVISRAGANAICDQILNARSFERQGFSMVLEEEDLTKETLTSTVYKLFEKRGSYVDAMRNSNQQDSIDTIISMITQASK